MTVEFPYTSKPENISWEKLRYLAIYTPFINSLLFDKGSQTTSMAIVAIRVTFNMVATGLFTRVMVYKG
jgi:hypothetical protein